MAYIGQDPVIGRYIIVDQISGGFNGTASGFTLAAGGQGVIPGLAQNVLLSLGGVIQQPGTDYTVSGSGITFTTPPLSGTTFFATVLGDVQAVGTPSDGTVLPASIATSGTFVFPNITTTGTTLIASGNASTPSLAVIGDTNTGLYSPGADQLAISTNGTGRLFIDSSGRVLVGTSTSRTVGDIAHNIQLEGASGNTGISIVNNYSTLADPSAYITLARSRSSTVGGSGLVSSGDYLGLLDFTGNDGSSFKVAARIGAFVDGTPGASDMPGRLVFSTTADGASNPTERLRITSAGLVGVGSSSPEGQLHVEGGQTYMNRNGAGNQQVLQLNNSDTTAGTQIVKLAFGSSGSTKASINAAVYGNDYLAFNTGSDTERMRLTGTGLGVGTSSPQALCHVYGGASSNTLPANAQAIFEYSANGGIAVSVPAGNAAGLYFPLSTDAYYAGIERNGTDLTFRNNGSTKATLDSSGRLGIGTSSPQNALHAYHATDNGVLRIESGDEYVHIEFKDPTTTNIPYIGAQGDNLRMITGGAAAVTIDSSQRVGIGTTSPSQLLHLSVSSGINYIRTSNGTVDYYNGINSSNEIYIGSTTTHPITFRIGDSEKTRIDTSGRLLVGTSSSRGNWFNTTFADPLVQLEGSSSTRLSITRNDNSDNSGELMLGNSRSSAYAVLSNNDNLGRISFQGADGSEMVAGAYIQCFVDGTPGANDMPGRLVFSTTADGASSPTERMRISNGGQSSHFAAATVITSASATGAGTGEYLFVGQHSATAINNGTDSIRITTNGNITNTNNSYGAISDIKLKENIVDANSQWDDLKALQVRNYNFKEGQTHTQIGLVAQEAELVSPGLVSESPDRDEEGNDLGTVTKSVNYSVLYMKAVKALQEAMERIEALEADVAQLKGA